MILRDTKCITEPLIMGDLSLAEEFDGVADVGVIYEAKNVIIRYTRFLFFRQILVQIGENVALDADISGSKRCSACGLRINSRGMVDKIGVKARFFDFLGGEIARELIQDRCNHFEMGEFFCTYKRKQYGVFWTEKSKAFIK